MPPLSAPRCEFCLIWIKARRADQGRKKPMRHKRIIVTHYGGPDALEVLEEERPEPKHGEVRVRVLAAGVGLPDIMAREGVHPETPQVPFTPGWDLVGVADRLGDGVSGIEPGQPVAALPIHGASRNALRPGGRVVGYGTTTSLRGQGLASGRPGRRNRLHGIPNYALYIAGGWLLLGRKRVVPYSIQTLKRLRPALFRQDLVTLLDLLRQKKIKPLVAQRFPLAEAKQAQELLGKGGVVGKIVLVGNGSLSRAA
jgi:NADPH:quinone reductase-like Zn-dependent oxidoreductase